MNDLFYIGVKAVVRNEAGQVLLLRSEDYWDLPGGRMQVGETQEETLRREVLEETGLTVETIASHVGMSISGARLKRPDGGQAGLIFSVYECQIQPGEVVLSKEHLDYKWLEPAAAAAQLAGKFSPAQCAAVAQQAKTA